jgi:hypothetical protein
MQNLSLKFAFAPLIMDLAEELRGANEIQSCENIWHFIKRNIKYVKDSPNKEQVRTPVRTLQDRKGDCDCMSVLTSSLLHYLRIPHLIRIVQVYKSTWEHVYIVALIENTEYVIDCVPEITKVFQEHPYKKKEDFMSEFAVALAGTGVETEDELSNIDGLSRANVDKIIGVAGQGLKNIIAALKTTGLTASENAAFKALVKETMILSSVKNGTIGLQKAFTETMYLQPFYAALMNEGIENVSSINGIEYLPEKAVAVLNAVDEFVEMNGLGRLKIGSGLKNAFKKIGNVAVNVAAAAIPGAGAAIETAKAIRDEVKGKKKDITSIVPQTTPPAEVTQITQTAARAGAQEQPKTPTDTSTSSSIGFFQKALDFLKKHWLKFAIAIVILVAGFWFFRKKDKPKIQKVGLNGLEGVGFKR